MISSPRSRSQRFFSNICFKSFILLNIVFKLMIYFKLIFPKDVSLRSMFIFVVMDVQLFQHHLWKKLSFSFELLLHLCKKKITGAYVWFYFWVLYSVLLFYVFIPSLISHSLDYCNYIMS